jgi:hypothetical protein
MRLIVTAVLGLAVLACSPGVNQAAAPKDTGKPTGTLPEGWKARLDDPAASLDAVRVTVEKDAVAFTTGPAGLYYKPDMKAEKDYTLSASLSELKPSATPQPFGLFVAGADLDKDAPRYTAFLIRSDGMFQIESRNGGTTTVIVPWKAAAEMREPKGVKTTNTLTIRTLQDAIHFLIADKEVHQMPREKAGEDGVAGIRIGSGLNVQVTALDVKKFP